MSDTRLSKLATLADVASAMLRQHPDAPEACGVELNDRSNSGPRVHLQLVSRPSEFHAVAGWAVELGTTVSLEAFETYVMVAARVETMTAHGPVVFEAWDHVTRDEAAPLMDLDGGPVEFAPQDLLDKVGGGS